VRQARARPESLATAAKGGALKPLVASPRSPPTVLHRRRTRAGVCPRRSGQARNSQLSAETPHSPAGHGDTESRLPQWAERPKSEVIAPSDATHYPKGLPAPPRWGREPSLPDRVVFFPGNRVIGNAEPLPRRRNPGVRRIRPPVRTRRRAQRALHRVVAPAVRHDVVAAQIDRRTAEVADRHLRTLVERAPPRPTRMSWPPPTSCLRGTSARSPSAGRARRPFAAHGHARHPSSRSRCRPTPPSRSSRSTTPV
jgi:hypothetical protein